MRDYRVVNYLLDHSTDFADLRPQRFILMLYYHLMRFWYRVLRGFSGKMSRDVVLQMALVVGHLAQYAGERSVTRRA